MCRFPGRRWFNYIDPGQKTIDLKRELRESPIPKNANWPITEMHGVRGSSAPCSLVSHLDHGCGKQTLANALPQFTVHAYDPAISGLHTATESHDLVICTDILEHVEPQFVDMVTDDLARVTHKTLSLQVAISSNQRLASVLGGDRALAVFV